VEAKTHRFSVPQRSLAVILALTAITIAIVVWIAAARLSPGRLWGDEGTYVAMTESLVRDRDLTFGEADRDWAAKHRVAGSTTVILQKTERGIAYSKPVLYPLLAAPLQLVLGEPGMVVTNLLLLTLALVLSWRHLSRMGHPVDALWVLATFSLCSAFVPYVGWKMSDLAQAAITLSGLILVLGPVQRRETALSDRSAIAGGVLLGMAVSMRYPTAAFIAAVVGALLLHRKIRRAALFLTASMLTLIALNSLSTSLIGSSNPYKSIRASFNGETGYPVAASDPSTQRFVSAVATQSATWIPAEMDRRTLYSSLYFLVGRHTGLLLYFPVALLLLLYCLRRPSRIGLMLIGAIAVISIFYLVWMPDNYFGGSTFLGNRYFLGAFPALLVGLRRLPSPRYLASAWILATLTWTSALVSVVATHDIDPGSQNHSHAGIFRFLPFESTAQRIDGVVDRFWDEDLIRFVDPFVAVARWSFRLDTGDPPAELLVVTDSPRDSIFFVVSPSDPTLRIEISDWLHSESFSFSKSAAGSPGLIEFRAAPAWRVHPFWWKGGDRPYNARTIRLQAVGESLEPASATVRFLGRGRVLAQLQAEFLGADLPSRVVAGSTGRIRIRARNKGSRPWDSADLLPAQLGYRVVEAESGRLVEHDRKRVTTKVRKGEVLDQTLDIHWPNDAGSYELIIELLRGPAARLGEKGRLELARAEIESVAP